MEFFNIIVFVEMRISKLINYLTNVFQSYQGSTTSSTQIELPIGPTLWTIYIMIISLPLTIHILAQHWWSTPTSCIFTQAFLLTLHIRV